MCSVHVTRANIYELPLCTDRLGKFAKPAAPLHFAREKERRKKQRVVQDTFLRKDLEVLRAKGYPDGISFAP